MTSGLGALWMWAWAQRAGGEVLDRPGTPHWVLEHRWTNRSIRRKTGPLDIWVQSSGEKKVYTRDINLGTVGL